MRSGISAPPTAPAGPPPPASGWEPSPPPSGGACGEAELYEKRIGELAGRWRAVLSRVRSGSTLDLLLGILPGTPLLTVKSAARLTARSEAAAANAVGRLLEAGILIQKNIGRQRYRIFEAPDALRLFAEMERSLAYP